ncbi:MAG: hypothetical protein ACQKBY_00840 [Verrucomicrobiales bacterium]
MKATFKRTLLAALALTGSAQAELGTLKETLWLGYFTGWEEKAYDFGIGSDAEILMVMKNNKRERINFRDFKVNYLVQEEIKGKWVTRKIDEASLSSESEPEIDPSDPVKVTFSVTGDTKVAFTHVMSRGMMTVKAELLEKTTENPIRLGLAINFPPFNKGGDLAELDERELKKKFRSDRFEAVRKSDGEKLKLKFHEPVDFSSEEVLAEGATEIEVQSDGVGAGDFLAELGHEDMGTILVSGGAKLYEGKYKLTWLPDMDKLKERDNYISFGLK